MATEHWELWRRAGSGDRHARERLIEENMPLARSLAVQYRHAREPLEDLCQVAMLGLVKAVDRFQPDRGIAFASYAVPTILGELRRHFRDRTWTIHVSRGMQEAIARVEGASEALRGQLGRYPSADEVAVACGVTVEEVTEARLASGASRLASLDAALPRDDAGDGALGDAIGAADGELGRVEDALWLQQIAEGLTDREREILRLRFVEDLVQREIAERVGVSQMHVSRILRDALLRLASAAA
jgi:RNA polymerase sigma-B factor